MKENIFGLVYAINLCLDELSNCHPWSSFLRQIEQLASVFEVYFPRV